MKLLRCIVFTEFAGTTLKDRKELAKSQKNALWLTNMNLEVILVCTQTTEIQNVIIIRVMILESDESFLPSVLSFSPSHQLSREISYDRERPSNWKKQDLQNVL